MTCHNAHPADACCAATATDCPQTGASCRWPVLTLFFGAAFWLVASSVFALVASIKFHQPNFLADCAWLTYGRVHAAHLNALAYGFAAQAGLGVTLWLLAQTSKSKLALPGASVIAAKLWNIGVLVGVGSILAGNNTGFDWLEFSQAGAVILFIAYLVLALAGILTFAAREEKSGCVSQWFLLAALFWFPWIYMTAETLVGCAPVRGVTQAVIAWWFADNFLFVWLGLISIGAMFHFAPKFAGRSLHSRQLALFAFAILISFGSWMGVPVSAPVPAWLSALGGFAALVTLTGVAAVMLNLKETVGRCLCLRREAAPKFFGIGAWSLGFFAMGKAIVSLSCCARALDFTWFAPALNCLLLYGFVAMPLIGAVYHIAPQLTRSEYFCTRPLKIHFWLAFIGLALLVVPLALAGKTQGALLNNPAAAVSDVNAATLPFLRASTTGDLLILLGGLTLLVNLVGLLRAACKNCCCKSEKAEVAK